MKSKLDQLNVPKNLEWVYGPRVIDLVIACFHSSQILVCKVLITTYIYDGILFI